MFVVAGSPHTWQRSAWIALLACGGGAVLSYEAAAYVHGMVDDAPAKIDVTVPYRTGNGEATVHRALKLDRRTVSGFPVTSSPRTLVDLAAVVAPRTLARALDTALLRGLVTIAVVRRYIRSHTLGCRPGIASLTKLLDDREFGVPESELERRALDLIAKYRLPAPARQQRIGTHRVDFAYPVQRVLVEVDGRATHGTAEAFEEDPIRQNELVLEGWTILRFTWKQITQDPDYVAQTIRRAVQ